MIDHVVLLTTTTITTTTSPPPQSNNQDFLIAIIAVVLDFLILLLIAYEDFFRVYLSRPKLMIFETLEKSSVPRTSPDSVQYQLGEKALQIPLATMIESQELWLTVTNEGKTMAKRMRGRVKVQFLSKIEMSKEMEEQSQRFLFGQPLPFKRFLRYTMPVQWIESTRNLSYEVDLFPKSDEVFIRLASVHPIDKIGEFLMKNPTPEMAKDFGANKIEQETLKKTMKAYIEVGSYRAFLDNPIRRDEPLIDTLVKFWIVSENVKNVSEIFHIRIPADASKLDFERLPKDSEEYKNAEAKLSLSPK